MSRGRLPRFILRASIGASLFLLGCGSGGGPAGGTGGVGGGQPGVGSVIWFDDGVKQTATGSGAFVGSAMMDLIQIAAGNAAGIGIAFGVADTPPLLPKTYVCAQNGMRPIVSISYTRPGVGPIASACTVEIITTGVATGTRGTGTFSATFPLDAGGTKAITNGTFDVQVIASTLP